MSCEFCGSGDYARHIPLVEEYDGRHRRAMLTWGKPYYCADPPKEPCWRIGIEGWCLDPDDTGESWCYDLCVRYCPMCGRGLR